MAKTGRKDVYTTHMKPRFNEIVDWLRHGATERQVAHNIGVGYSTYLKHKAQNKEFQELVKNAKQSLIVELRGALVKKALGFTYTETKKSTKIENGQPIQYIEETTKQALPDVAAINLALKNYDSDNWANDPQMLKFKEKELELRREIAEKDDW